MRSKTPSRDILVTIQYKERRACLLPLLLTRIDTFWSTRALIARETRTGVSWFLTQMGRVQPRFGRTLSAALIMSEG